MGQGPEVDLTALTKPGDPPSSSAQSGQTRGGKTLAEGLPRGASLEAQGENGLDGRGVIVAVGKTEGG